MHERVLKSYELMLDFYGMKLKDRNTGYNLVCVCVSGTCDDGVIVS